MYTKKGIQDFFQMKQKGEKITFVTCYDYPVAFSTTWSAVIPNLS